jgi:SAM-dependent methyltransferase
MHQTAAKNAQRFFNTYVNKIESKISILEIGSQLGGFNIRSLSPPNATYVGLDIAPAPGVDVVLEDEYVFPFKDNTFDFIISSSCFEHIDFFWLTFLEILRVLKPDGVFYLNAPSNGDFHRYPIDCWRFFPDSGHSLSKWGKRNGFNCELLEQYTSDKEDDIWSDYISIFIKNQINTPSHPSRILDNLESDFVYTNGSIFPHNNIINLKHW